MLCVCMRSVKMRLGLAYDMKISTHTIYIYYVMYYNNIYTYINNKYEQNIKIHRIFSRVAFFFVYFCATMP